MSSPKYLRFIPALLLASQLACSSPENPEDSGDGDGSGDGDSSGDGDVSGAGGDGVPGMGTGGAGTGGDLVVGAGGNLVVGAGGNLVVGAGGNLVVGAGGDANTGAGGGSNTSGDVGEVDAAHCAPTDNWDPKWTALEDEILVIVNQRRAEGANCGGEGDFPAKPPFEMHAALRCAARLHSQDMVDRDFFDHENPSGESPWVRIDAAAVGDDDGMGSGENIAAGNSTAAETMEQWMGSDGHCANIMSDAEYIGVGYYPGGDYGHVWTQTMGRD